MEDIMKKKISELTEDDTKVEEYFVKLKSAYRTGEGDQEALIELVTDAMGKRSQRQFAADIGVNVSSISRILSGKVSEVSDVILAKIAANADPASDVTIEKLMAAQGLIEAENRVQLRERYKESCRRIIADELLRRGHSVSYVNDQKHENMTFCDFEIVTDALPKGEGRWLVETKMMSIDSAFPAGSGRIRTWLDSAMAAYYRGENAGRISLVVDNVGIFNQVKLRLTDASIRDEISVILISIGAGKICDEYVIPLSDGTLPDFTFKKQN